MTTRAMERTPTTAEAMLYQPASAGVKLPPQKSNRAQRWRDAVHNLIAGRLAGDVLRQVMFLFVCLCIAPLLLWTVALTLNTNRSLVDAGRKMLVAGASGCPHQYQTTVFRCLLRSAPGIAPLSTQTSAFESL